MKNSLMNLYDKLMLGKRTIIETVNDNPFYRLPEIKAPIVSEKINPQQPLLYKVYEYDVQTTAGQQYTFERQ